MLTVFKNTHPELYIPYTDLITPALQFVYFAQHRFMEGASGLSGRSFVLILRQDMNNMHSHCYRCIDYFDNMEVDQPMRHIEQINNDIDPSELRVLQQELRQGGVFAIQSLTRGITTAATIDIIGIRTAPMKEHWYTVSGWRHTDERHNRFIYPIIERELQLHLPTQ